MLFFEAASDEKILLDFKQIKVLSHSYYIQNYFIIEDSGWRTNLIIYPSIC